MRRAWILILCLSVGLNAGLLITVLRDRGAFPPSEGSFSRGFRKGPPHLREEFRSPQLVKEELGRRVRRLSHDLGLSEEQTRSLIEIRERAFPELVENHQRMAEVRDHLREAYIEGAEGERIREYVRELNEMRSRIDMIIAEAMIDEARLLTPDQRAGYAASLPWEHTGPRDARDTPDHHRGRNRED